MYREKNILCTHLNAYKEFLKFTSKTQNWLSRINTCLTFRFAYSQAGTASLIPINDLDFNTNVYPGTTIGRNPRIKKHITRATEYRNT